MEIIQSFQIDHEKLEKGLFISRVDEDLITFDLRMKKPNREEVMTTSSIHAIEHLGATYLRNSYKAKDIIYFGPMGCRTGFYLIIRNSNKEEALSLLIKTCEFILNFEGEIPGATPIECGNYSDMDLERGKKDIEVYYEILKNPSDENLIYPEK